MPQITNRDLVAFADEKVKLKKSEVGERRRDPAGPGRIDGRHLRPELAT